MTILSILTRSASSQPLSAISRQDEKNDDGLSNSLWLQPVSESESNEGSLDNDVDDQPASSVLKQLLAPSESGRMNQPNSSEPVRRANFWKRANFWRKRANFWRRELAP